MSSNLDPYIPHNPGDLWTAEDWNDVQKKIKQDIGAQIKVAVDNKKTIEHADNADKLENQSADELTQSILEKARQELPQRTGYRKLFKVLVPNVDNVIEHNLESFPLVDIYQLMPFSAICSEDDEKNKDDDTYFYLYNKNEQKVRFTPAGTTTAVSVENEPADGPAFRIPFKDMLVLYKVKYTDTTTLDDLETDFWDAFKADPNDSFDDDDFCHSPWFDRCCGENRTVGQLKQAGNWEDDLFFKVMPRKTVNKAVEQIPKEIVVNQYSFNKLGIKFVPTGTGPAAADLRVLVLLKV